MRWAVHVGMVAGLWLAALCLPARAIVLRYTPEVGTSLVYAYAMYVDQEAGRNAAGVPARSQAASQAAISLKVVEKTPEGVREEGTVRGGSFTSSLPGVPGDALQTALPETTFAVTVDERGGLRDLSVTGPGGAIGDLLPAVVGFAGFPEKDAAPGDTWTAAQQVVAAGTGWGVHLEVKCHLLELVTYRGQPCAKIRIIYRGPVSATPSTAVSGQLQGTALGYYDYARSVWMAQEGKASGTVVLRTPKEQGKGVPPVRVVLTKRYTAMLVEPAAPNSTP